MKDAFGNELAIGDTIVYTARRSSSMWLTKTTIVGFGTRARYWAEGKQIETAICINPNYKSIEDQRAEFELSVAEDAAKVEKMKANGEQIPWWLDRPRNFYGSQRPKTVTLSVPEYIVKV